MSTIRRRAKDQWQAQVRMKGHPPQSKTFPTRGDAERWARNEELAILSGAPRLDKSFATVPLDECLKRYGEEITPRKKGHLQELNLINRLRKSLPFAKRPIAQTQGVDIAHWRDRRTKEVAPATVMRELALVSHVFTIAAKEWGMETLQNPVLRVQKPRLPRGRARRVRSEEIDQIVANSQSVELGLLIKFAVETAMRRSEICRLKWSDIDLERSTLRINELLPLTEN